LSLKGRFRKVKTAYAQGAYRNLADQGIKRSKQCAQRVRRRLRNTLRASRISGVFKCSLD
jgi:hypothetical protein